MDIHKQLRHPSVVEGQPGTHLRCICLQEVTVQIQQLARHTGTQFLRTVLVDSITGSEVLVSIYVEDRNKQYAHPVKNLYALFPDHHITDPHIAGILAIWFTGMDTSLHQQDHPPPGTDLFR